MSHSPADPFRIAEFRRCGEPAGRCPLRTAGVGFIGGDGGGLRCLGSEDRSAAANRLRGYLFHSGDIGTLRRIASKDNVMSGQLSDDQIVQQVAAMVERREVCLLASVRDRSVGFAVQDGPRPSETVRPSATGLTPSRYQPRPTPEAPVSPAGPPVHSLATVDDTQQVAGLEEAARDGAPFCAVCEKARQ